MTLEAVTKQAMTVTVNSSFYEDQSWLTYCH